MSRQHNQECFYKYVSAETAQKVLISKRVKYSSPASFNDPFDHSVEFRASFDKDTLLEMCLEEIAEIVFDDKPVDIIPESLLSGIYAIKQLIRRNKSREDFINEMREVLIVSIDRLDSFCDDINRESRQAIQRNAVFCLSERNDSILMWSHYARNHTGAVIQIDCIDEIDNAELAAIQVSYSEDLPPIGEIEDFVKFITGQASRLLDVDYLFKHSVATKSSDWSYEQEWRVLLFDQLQDGESHTFQLVHPRTLGSIYLGCRMTPSDREKIAKIIELSVDLQHMKIYQAHKSKTKFGIEFERIR